NASPDSMIAVAVLLETATTRTTARTTALTRAYPAVGSEGVANTYAMANRLLTRAFIEATTTRRAAARPMVTVSLLFSIGASRYLETTVTEAASAADSVSRTTSLGCETIARWLDGISTIVAPIRLANRR